MFRIDNASSANLLPTPSIPGPNPNGYFSHGTPDQDSPVFPTTVDFDLLNCFQEEICNVIEFTDAILDKNDRTQFHAAIQYLINLGPAGVPGIPDVEADTTPQLGGDLIFGAYSVITTAGNINIIPNGTGAVDLNKAATHVKTNIVHKGNIGTKIIYGTDTQAFQISSNNQIDISSTGLMIAATGARVTTILDEDNMSSDSATALLTQQSAKAYVDSLISPNMNYLSLQTTNIVGFNAGDVLSGLILIGNTSVDIGAMVLPRAVIVSNLRVIYPQTWNTSNGVMTFTVRINGTNTAITTSFGLTDTSYDVEDSTHSVTANSGDILDILVTGTNSGTIVLFAMDISLKLT